MSYLKHPNDKKDFLPFNQQGREERRISFAFGKERSSYKSPLYIRMETMIENVKKYQEDFKGQRVPIFLKKSLSPQAKQYLMNKNRSATISPSHS